MTTPYEAKRRYIHSKGWKELPDKIKEELRASWKALDSQCKQMQGHTKLLPSLGYSGIKIKGCIIDDYHYSVDEEKFVQMVNAVENQVDKNETIYAVLFQGTPNEHGSFQREYLYETDSDWHHIKLIENNDLEDDTLGITLEKHHRTYRDGDDSHTRSGIEEYMLRMKRIRKTTDEFAIKEMLETTKKLKEKYPGPMTDDELIYYKLNANSLAEKLKKYFEVS